MSDIRSLEQRLSKLEKKVAVLEQERTKQPKKSDKEAEEFKGLTGAIFDLIKESFFNQPRELSEIQKQVKANAVFYPRTSYPDALLRLVKKKKLRRINEKGKWMYVKHG